MPWQDVVPSTNNCQLFYVPITGIHAIMLTEMRSQYNARLIVAKWVYLLIAHNMDDLRQSVPGLTLLPKSNTKNYAIGLSIVKEKDLETNLDNMCLAVMVLQTLAESVNEVKGK